MPNTENNYTETDLGNISLNPRGEYDNSAAYEYLDTVSYQGGSYFCLAELETTITGIAPDAGRNSEHWQMIAASGDMTPEYTAAYNDVIKKAVQVETSRAAVELAQQEIEAVQTDVQQLHSDTVQAAQEAENSKNSAANSAQSAEQSRKTVSESEQNIKGQITGFDSRVSEAVEQSKAEINTTKQQAIDTITNQQNTSVNAVKAEGEKIITRVGNDAKTVANDRATVEEAAQTVLNNAQEVAQNTQTVASNTEKAAASAEGAKTSADNAAQSAKSVEDASKQIEQNKKDIDSLKEDTAALQKRQNVLAGSESGNPVSCDDAFEAPLCGLHIYGKSTQDGTPSPDNPVPIVSAGDGGSVVVRVTGKNLLNPALFQNNKYQGFNAETGYYGIDSVNGYWITGIQPCLPNTTYHFNKNTEGGCFYDNEKKVLGIIGFDYSFKTPIKCAYYCVNFSEINIPYGSQVVATVNAPATVSPYYEQTLTLQTPTGLPGIPVTSGGNYTDQTGQQWVCDEIDLERGVMVQRVDKTAFDTTKSLAEQKATLVTPIETPLTSDEIAAYKALAAYAPNTVVQASDSAGIKLDYQRDVNIAVKRIEDAIASMTTT